MSLISYSSLVNGIIKTCYSNITHVYSLDNLRSDLLQSRLVHSFSNKHLFDAAFWGTLCTDMKHAGKTRVCMCTNTEDSTPSLSSCYAGGTWQISKDQVTKPLA